MNKTQEIQKVLSAPIEVGNDVSVRFSYASTESLLKGKKRIEVPCEKQFFGDGKVVSLDGVHALIEFYGHPSVPKFQISGGKYLIPIEYIKNDISDCGSNPFKKQDVRINFINAQLSELLSRCGYGRQTNNFSTPEYSEIKSTTIDREKKFVGCTYGGCNLDPYVIDVNGNKVHYQRGYVWNTDQKKLLIDSIYNNIEIGKFIFKHNSWPFVESQMAETGHGFDFDCVDGKQRISAIIEFVQDKFQDSFGNYFSDLSKNAQRRFFNYDKFALGTMDERTKDQDIVSTFLTLNFTGVPMSKDHLDYVRSIKI